MRIKEKVRRKHNGESCLMEMTELTEKVGGKKVGHAKAHRAD